MGSNFFQSHPDFRARWALPYFTNRLGSVITPFKAEAAAVAGEHRYKCFPDEFGRLNKAEVAVASTFSLSDPCLNTAGGNGGGWAGKLYPYVKSVQIFVCPSTRVVDTSDSSYKDYPIGANYGLNNNLASAAIGKSLSSVSAAASTVLLCEQITGRTAGGVPAASVNLTDPNEDFTATFNGYNVVGQGNAACGTWGNLPQTGTLGGRANVNFGKLGCWNHDPDLFSTPIHFDGSNFLAVDGHVKWLKPGQVSGGATALAPGNAQSATEASAADKLTLSDGTTPCLLTFSPT